MSEAVQISSISILAWGDRGTMNGISSYYYRWIICGIMSSILSVLGLVGNSISLTILSLRWIFQIKQKWKCWIRISSQICLKIHIWAAHKNLRSACLLSSHNSTPLFLGPWRTCSTTSSLVFASQTLCFSRLTSSYFLSTSGWR